MPTPASSYLLPYICILLWTSVVELVNGNMKKIESGVPGCITVISSLWSLPLWHASSSIEGHVVHLSGWPSRCYNCLLCCFKPRCKECTPCSYFSSPLCKLPIHCPLLMRHFPPALICTLQTLIASLPSSFLSSQLQMCLLVILRSAHWLVFMSVLTFHAKGIRVLGLSVLLFSQLPSMCGGFTLLSYPWENFYLWIAALFSCLWFWFSLRVCLWTSIYFSDKGSNVMPLFPLPTGLYVIVTRTRPDCLLLKGQCLQMRAVAMKKREE